MSYWAINTHLGTFVCKVDPVWKEAKEYKTATDLRQLHIPNKDVCETKTLALEAKNLENQFSKCPGNIGKDL